MSAMLLLLLQLVLVLASAKACGAVLRHFGQPPVIGEMAAAGRSGSVVSLLCDSGDRYDHTYFNDDWVSEQQLDLGPPTAALERFYATGVLPEPSSQR